MHYTPQNSLTLNVQIAELIRIWNQSRNLIETYEKVEEFKESKFSKKLGFQIDILQEAWT